MTVLTRVRNALGANVATQAISTAIQLLTVPYLLNFWSVEHYGGWLLLCAIPAYVALSDFGFLSVSLSRITIFAAQGEIERVNRVFQTGLAVWILVVAGTSVINLIFLSSYNSGLFSQWNNKIAFFLLVLCAILSMGSYLVEGAFRTEAKYATGIHLQNLSRITEWLGLIIGVFLHQSFIGAATGQFVGRFTGLTVSIWFAKSAIKQVKWNIRGASGEELRLMIKPALGFMGFPVGNAISIQGIIVANSIIFGASFAAAFNTYRTLSRTIVQASTVISKSIWPEISRQFGLKNGGNIKKLFWRGTAAALTLSLLCVIGISFFGEQIIGLWTRGKVIFDSNIFYAVLSVSLLSASWQVGMVVLSGANQHTKLGVTYLISSIVGILAIFILSPYFNEYAGALGMLITELSTIIFVGVFIRQFFKSLPDSSNR